VKEYREARRKIGLSPQEFNIDIFTSIRRTLDFVAGYYGMRKIQRNERTEELLKRFGLIEHADKPFQELSGGLKRRVELAKGLLHKPSVLLLDEPSTGLDPGGRIDLWKYLINLSADEGVTVLVTTHLMEEAEKCSRVAIMNEGLLVCSGTPGELKKEVSEGIILVRSQNSKELAEKIQKKFNVKTIQINGTIQIEHEKGPSFMKQLVEAFPKTMDAITYRNPTLEDVFVHHTGHQFWKEEEVQ